MSLLRVGDIWYRAFIAEDSDPTVYYECYKVVQVRGKATALLQSAYVARSTQEPKWTSCLPVKGMYKHACGRVKLPGRYGAFLKKAE